MNSGQHREQQDQIRQVRQDLGETTEELAHRLDVPTRARAGTQQAMGSARETAQQAMGSARETAQQAMGNARETAQQTMGNARETAQQTMGNARETAQSIPPSRWAAIAAAAFAIAAAAVASREGRTS